MKGSFSSPWPTRSVERTGAETPTAPTMRPSTDCVGDEEEQEEERRSFAEQAGHKPMPGLIREADDIVPGGKRHLLDQAPLDHRHGDRRSAVGRDGGAPSAVPCHVAHDDDRGTGTHARGTRCCRSGRAHRSRGTCRGPARPRRRTSAPASAQRGCTHRLSPAGATARVAPRWKARRPARRSSSPTTMSDWCGGRRPEMTWTTRLTAGSRGQTAPDAPLPPGPRPPAEPTWSSGRGHRAESDPCRRGAGSQQQARP